MLVRLMYASRAAAGVDDEELHGILRHAKTANPKRGVTGALCFADGIFIQVLEGGREALVVLPARRDVLHERVRHGREAGARRFISGIALRRRALVEDTRSRRDALRARV